MKFQSSIAMLLVASGLSSGAAAQDLRLPATVYGTYAPSGDCSRQPRISVDKAGIHIDTPAGRRGPLPIMVSYTWAGGASYDGIQTWALVKHGGKDRYGDDQKPIIITFNLREQRGVLAVEHVEPQVRLDGPLSSIVQAGSFRICRAGATAATPPARPAGAPSAPAAVPPSSTPAPQAPAAGFAAVVGALMQPASAPAGAYYDWRFIERAPGVAWAALPPEMLDKPLADGHFFRRNGTLMLGGQSLKFMAAGARGMVMNHYIKNEGRPIGEAVVIAALRGAGLTVTPARCGISRALMAPTWYRLSGGGKRAALLWIAQPRGAASPWEGFNLSLDVQLKPLTPRESAVFTDKCA